MVPAVSLAVSPDRILESGGARTVTVSATLDNEVAMADEATTVTLGRAGTAIDGTDYTGAWGSTPPTITIPANSMTGSNTVTLTLTPIDDELSEGEETIVVEGTATTGTRDLVVKVATVTLQDDDVRGVVVEPTTLALDEGTAGAYTVHLTAQPTGPVTVSIGGASGTDVTVSSSVLTFTPGNWSNAQTVTVTAGADADAVMDEDVVLTHTVGGSDYVDVEAADVTVTVRETTVPQVAIADVVADESAGSMVFTVTLDVESGAEVQVPWATAGVTATAGADYTESSGTVTFPPRATSRTVPVPILEDDLDEEAETFTVTLSKPPNADLADGEATGTITDNDAEPALTLSDPPSAATEGVDANLVFTVTLAPASGRAVTVDYATRNGTAGAPGDSTAPAANASLTFAPGETSKTITVPIVNDALDESEETFTVHLSGEQGATVADGEATGTIVDDDDEPVLDVEDVTEAEDVGDMAFEVTLTPASGRAVTVSYATADGTAAEPGDYGATTGTVTFAAGDDEDGRRVDRRRRDRRGRRDVHADVERRGERVARGRRRHPSGDGDDRGRRRDADRQPWRTWRLWRCWRARASWSSR